MPKAVRSISIIIYASGLVYVYGSLANETHKATPVQPHGRLVEAQQVEYQLCESDMPQKYRDFCRRVINSEYAVPTILPATKYNKNERREKI